jgi:hypothetical protein
LIRGESCKYKKGVPLVLRQKWTFSLNLETKNFKIVISTYHLNVGGIHATNLPIGGLSEIGERLVGRWKSNSGEPAYIQCGPDNTFGVVNENGGHVLLKIQGSSLIPTHWDVHPVLSLDGKVLDWGNNTTWIR